MSVKDLPSVAVMFRAFRHRGWYEIEVERDHLELRIHLPAATLNPNGGSESYSLHQHTHCNTQITSTKMCLSQLPAGNWRILELDKKPPNCNAP